MRYLLDTSALIDLSKGVEPARSHLRTMIEGDDEVGICAITVAEFYTGVPPERRRPWDDLMNQLAYWDIGLAAAQQAGQDRFAFARQGRQLTVADTLIAAVAREQGAILVTANPRDFPMPDIQVLAIRDAGR